MAQLKVTVVGKADNVAVDDVFPLAEDTETVIGKNSAEATLLITGDSCISGKHCTVLYEQRVSAYMVVNHSKNATEVNGQPVVSRKILNIGATIRVHATDLLLEEAE